MFTECKGLEREIVLVAHKKTKSISEISKELNKSIQIIGKTIERMQNQDLIIRIHDYKEDARKSKISINSKRIMIEKSHTFYLTYYILIAISMISSGIISLILKNLFLIVGSVIVALPILLMMLYQVYLKEDKTIVYKNPKITKKDEKLGSKKQVDKID